MSLLSFLRRQKANRLGLLGATLLVVLLALALAGPWLGLPDPTRGDLRARMLAPTISWAGLGAHPFGTDQLGRDILSRIIAGSRVTLTIAGSAVILGGVVGVLLGLIAGYFGGWYDRVLMRLVDIQLAFPLMLLALLVVAALGPDLHNLIAVLALTSWVRYARIIRAQVLTVREREFVQAALAMGAGHTRVMLRHILPNVLTPALVVATLELARTIVLEAGLSFLGLGIQPPSPSWGRMLADGRTYIASAWWIITLPGIALMLTVFSINLLGDWLRDWLDPQADRH